MGADVSSRVPPGERLLETLRKGMDNWMDWAEFRNGDASTMSRGSINIPHTTIAHETMTALVLSFSNVFRRRW
jgi:hypothetical protein